MKLANVKMQSNEPILRNDMKKLAALAALIAVACGSASIWAKPVKANAAKHGAAVSGPFTESERKQFAALDPIDTHAHIYHPSPIFNAMVERLNVRIIDILVIDNHGHNKVMASLPRERAAALRVIDENKRRMVLC